MSGFPIWRGVALALAFAAELAGASCGAQPVSPGACPSTVPTRQGSLFVLVADPSESSIRGLLPSAGPPSAGQPYAVRWVVDARKAGGQLRIQASREGTGQVYRETFAGAVSGQLAQFRTDLVFPAAGCWDADVFTGTAEGSLTFKVA